MRTSKYLSRLPVARMWFCLVWFHRKQLRLMLSVRPLCR